MKFLNKVTDVELMEFFVKSKKIIQGEYCTFSNINIVRGSTSVELTEDIPNTKAFSGIIFKDSEVICSFGSYLTEAQKEFFTFEWRKYMYNKFKENYANFVYGDKGYNGLAENWQYVAEKVAEESYRLERAEKRMKKVTEDFEKLKQDYAKYKQLKKEFASLEEQEDELSK